MEQYSTEQFIEEFNRYSSCQVADAMQSLGILPCHIDGMRLLSPGHPLDTKCRIVGHAHVAHFVSRNELPKSPIPQNFLDTCTKDCIVVIFEGNVIIAYIMVLLFRKEN
jgi:hypothetical protein